MRYYSLINSMSRGGSSYDADAQAFLTATATPNDGTVFFTGTAQEITGLQISEAVNNLVLDIKGYGIWSKILMLNPKILGTATAHKFNAKDPRDLDVAYRQTYGVNWVRNGLGAKADGNNTYGNTYINLTTLGLNANFSFGYYLTEANSLFGDRHGFGGYSSGSNWDGIQHQSSTEILGMSYGGGGTSLTISGANNGFFALSVIGTQKKVYHKSLVANGTTNGTSVANVNLWEGCLNVSNSFYRGLNGTYGTTFIAEGLTETEMGNLQTAIITFETALFRNV